MAAPFVDTARITVRSGNGGSAYETTVSVENIPVEFYGEDTYLADKGLMLLDDTESTVSVEVSGSKTALM